MEEVKSGGEESSASVFHSSLPIAAKLERARSELLDLSARNRLLNMPRSAKAAKIVEIVDERSDEVFRMLVREGRPFTFLPGKGVAEDSEGIPVSAGGVDLEVPATLAQPDDGALDERGVAARHSDTRLQTRLTSAGLQKRLLDLYHDARVLEEEQGVNILFLALGTLKWIDPNNAASSR